MSSAQVMNVNCTDIRNDHATLASVQPGPFSASLSDPSRD